MPQSYDWQAYCRKYNITADELKAIAAEIGLPMAQLGERQSQMLLSELERRFESPDIEVEQRSLF